MGITIKNTLGILNKITRIAQIQRRRPLASLLGDSNVLWP